MLAVRAFSRVIVFVVKFIAFHLTPFVPAMVPLPVAIEFLLITWQEFCCKL